MAPHVVTHGAAQCGDEHDAAQGRERVDVDDDVEHTAQGQGENNTPSKNTNNNNSSNDSKNNGVFVPYVAPTHLRLTPKPLLSSVPCNLAIRASAGLKSLHASIASQNDSACAHSLSSHQTTPPLTSNPAAVGSAVLAKSPVIVKHTHTSREVSASASIGNSKNKATAPAAAAAGAAKSKAASSASAKVVRTLADGRLDVGAHLPLLAGRYRYVCTIGSGATADVVLCDDTFQPQGARTSTVVVKIINRRYTSCAKHEVRVMRYLQTFGGTVFEPNACMTAAHAGGACARLLNAFSFHGHACLVVDRCHGGTLLEYIADSAAHTREARAVGVRKLAVQLVSALAAMHRRGVAHADLKPENILLTRPLASRGGASSGTAPSLAVRLVDFGNAIAVDKKEGGRRATAAEHGHNVGTLPYRAPEVLMECTDGFDERIDIWALGCVLAECALHRPLFEVYSPAQLLQRMCEVLEGTPPLSMLGDDAATPALGWLRDAGIDMANAESACKFRRNTRLFRELMSATDAQAADAICWMLRFHPDERPSFGQLASHGFLRGMVDLGVVVSVMEESMQKPVVVREAVPVPPAPVLPPLVLKKEDDEEEEEEEAPLKKLKKPSLKKNAAMLDDDDDDDDDDGEKEEKMEEEEVKQKEDGDAGARAGASPAPSRRSKKKETLTTDNKKRSSEMDGFHGGFYSKRQRKSGTTEWWKSSS